MHPSGFAQCVRHYLFEWRQSAKIEFGHVKLVPKSTARGRYGEPGGSVPRMLQGRHASHADEHLLGDSSVADLPADPKALAEELLGDRRLPGEEIRECEVVQSEDDVWPVGEQPSEFKALFQIGHRLRIVLREYCLPPEVVERVGDTSDVANGAPELQTLLQQADRTRRMITVPVCASQIVERFGEHPWIADSASNAESLFPERHRSIDVKPVHHPDPGETSRGPRQCSPIGYFASQLKSLLEPRLRGPDLPLEPR